MARPAIFDLILAVDPKTNNEIIVTVFGYEQPNHSVMGIPKYIPKKVYNVPFLGHFWKFFGKVWSRITYSPLIQKDRLAEVILKKEYPTFFHEGKFIIPYENIVNIFSAKEGAKLFCEMPRDKLKRENWKKIQELLLSFSQEIKLNCLGVTGSSLFYGDIDGFSDIDICVYGSNNYIKLCNFLKMAQLQNKDLHFRTIEEWCKYWEEGHYGSKVFSPFSKEIFARHMIFKYDQPIYKGVDVTIFAVRNSKERKELKKFINLRNNSLYEGKIRITATIKDARESMFMFPSLYLVSTSTENFIVENHIRPCISQGTKGDIVEISGELLSSPDGKKIINVSPTNNGYIINLTWLKKMQLSRKQ
jgi:predicted nucleotidyltransferase